jgi:hypothetical protein
MKPTFRVGVGDELDFIGWGVGMTSALSLPNLIVIMPTSSHSVYQNRIKSASS